VTIATALATRAASLGLPYVTISTDLVFDGRHNNAYIEPDLTQPLGLFGITKRDAEVQVMHAHAEALILRTGPLFGATPHEMLAAALRHAARDAGVNLDRDLIVSPTYIPDLADALLDLLIDGESGLWHLVNDGSVSAVELLRRFARDEDHPFEPTGRSGCNLALTSKRGLLLPKLATAFDRYSAAA
jgi:dTDP-4-dehydrorhamnose reductase